LADARAGGDSLALAKAQLAVREAEVMLASAKDERTKLTEGTDAVTLAAAQADVDKKRLVVADAEVALAGTSLIAPFDGKIVTIANLQQLQVLASVDETTIKKVVEGQSAQITFDALPGQTLRGQVGEIPLQGTLQGGVMVYAVPVSLTGAEKLPLLVGMTANVKIQTCTERSRSIGQAQNALLVPAMAVQRGSSGYQVLIPSSDPAGEPVAVPVEVGLSDGTYTQIVRGLNLGDKVVVQMSASSQTEFFGFGPMGGEPPPGEGGQQRVIIREP
jgi:HlyD family secretion protein